MSAQFTIADIQGYGVKAFSFDCANDCYRVDYMDGGKRDVPYTEVVDHGLCAFDRGYMAVALTPQQQQAGLAAAMQAQMGAQMQATAANLFGGSSHGLFGQSPAPTTSHSVVPLVGGRYTAACHTCGACFSVTVSHVANQCFDCRCGTKYIFTASPSVAHSNLTVITPQQVAYNPYAPQMQQQVAPVGAKTAAPESLKPDPGSAKLKGIKLGEIIGYRGWEVKDGFLHAYSADVFWAPHEIMDGKVKYHNHEGVYAYKTLRNYLKEFSRTAMVYGKIAMWGAVIEHELGYRAEFAKILSLDGAGHPDTSKELPRLRELYGV